MGTDLEKHFISVKLDACVRVKRLEARTKSYGVHSPIRMQTAGFRYTGKNDAAKCDSCDLEISEWTETMAPFTIHVQQRPQCAFVLSKLSTSASELYNQTNRTKRQKMDSDSSQYKHNFKFVEVKKLKQIRRRTYSHWSRRIKPSAEQMITAGFFSCNVGDRVICLYCNLICQQWSADTDDPSEVHKTLSPRCPYVLSMLMHPELSPTIILNDITNQPLGTDNNNQQRFDEIVYTTPCHTNYSDITKRLESFANWAVESSPPVDELVRAGFFYAGVDNAVTCFYCNGSLQNWTANDNPITEHARWFGQCPYAKQLCGDELHRKIQEASRLRQGKCSLFFERSKNFLLFSLERNRTNETNENSNLFVSNGRQLQINDPNMLSRLVAARLDLSNSQSLLDQQFKLSVIKRCWEDQLQLKSN